MQEYEKRWYPMSVDVRDKQIVVIGGGAVARRKVETFLEYGAQVKLVAPEVCEPLADLAGHGALVWQARTYEQGDLDGCLLAVCACGDERVNEQVVDEAKKKNCLLNVVDVPQDCNFIVPAILDRGPLQIAVSTAGAAPLVARQIKENLAQRYEPYWEEYLVLLGEVRGLVRARVSGDEATRKPLFEACVDGRLEARVAAGEHPDAQGVYDDYIAPLLHASASQQGGGIA